MQPDDFNLLYPCSIEDFFADWWEQSALHIDRAGNRQFESILAIADIETLLSTSDLSFPGVQLTRSQNPPSRSEYCDTSGRITPMRLLQHYRDGCTLIISAAHQFFPALAACCRDAQRRLQMRAQANVYLTPPAAQGFDRHYDTHDVFILQVSGSKRFRFYDSPLELPIPDDEFDPASRTDGPVSDEKLLCAGDTLYIPRGMVHDAVAADDEASLHITVGLFPLLLCDLMQEMIRVAAQQDVTLRRSAITPVKPAPDAANLESSLSSVMTQQNLQQALASLADEIELIGSSDCSGLLQAHPISSNTKLCISANVSYPALRRHESLELRTNGQIIEFSEPMASAVEWLLQQSTARVCDLPGLDSRQQTALAQQLIEQAVCRIEQG